MYYTLCPTVNFNVLQRGGASLIRERDISNRLLPNVLSLRTCLVPARCQRHDNHARRTRSANEWNINGVNGRVFSVYIYRKRKIEQLMERR